MFVEVASELLRDCWWPFSRWRTIIQWHPSVLPPLQSQCAGLSESQFNTIFRLMFYYPGLLRSVDYTARLGNRPLYTSQTGLAIFIVLKYNNCFIPVCVLQLQDHINMKEVLYCLCVNNVKLNLNTNIGEDFQAYHDRLPVTRPCTFHGAQDFSC